MRLDQVFVGEVEARGRDLAGHHPLGPPEEVLVVRAPRRAIGDDERRLAATAGAATPLRVVRWRGRHVAQVDDVEAGDIDAQLHRRRAIEDRKPGITEAALAVLADLARDLRGVLTRLQPLAI